MYAQLGTTIFQGLFSYTDLKKQVEAKYVEIQLMNGKSDLQYTNQMLDTITFNIRFHINFCDPQLRFEELKAYCVNGDVLPFLDGEGNLIGNYVIEKIEQTVTQTDPNGHIIVCECEVSLKEYVSPDRINARVQAAKNRANAIGDARGLTVIPNATLAPQALIFNAVSLTVANGAIATNNVTGPNPTAFNLSTCLKYLTAVQDGLIIMNTLVSEVQNEISIQQTFIDNILTVYNNSAALVTSVRNGDAANYLANSALLTSSLNNFSTFGLNMQKDLILRQ